ncbi:hypothetical protein HF289_08665 [Acidithiobacillus ferrooxidans]|uniref:hypothetical protein n=1 Tax=Acidithiobacillus ferrooxidans TaxID=920 RepID=UPI001C070CE9|nr:hypothetical protein [Acidithiobacillus ferrooxidans]MBU2856942.1 hypothetical protein [Acidithiobacillus ferrooxidans]
MALENDVEMSRTQLRKRIKEVLKNDTVMAGDGHLNLHSDQPRPLPAETVAAVQERILVALSAAQIAELDEAQVREIVRIVLLYIAMPNRGKAKKPQPKPQKAKPKKHKNKTEKKQNFEPSESGRRKITQRQPVIQVTIKKARNFHYPRDLPSGGDL